MTALQLTGNTPLFTPNKSRVYQLDILSYIVTDPNHPDQFGLNGAKVVSVGDIWYKRPYGLHRIPAALCPRLSFNNKECNVCEYRSHLELERKRERGVGHNPYTKQIQKLKPSSRNLYVVIPVNDPDFEEKPHIWDISYFLFQDLLNDEIEENEQYASFPDPDEGYTLNVHLKLKHFGPAPFVEAEKINFIKRDTAATLRVQKHLNSVPNLDLIIEANLRSTFQKLSSFKPTKIKPTKIRRGDPTSSNKEAGRMIQIATDLNKVLGLQPSIDIKASLGRIKILVREAAELIVPEDLPFLSADTRKVVERNTLTRMTPASDCPYGHAFGYDTDEYADCDDCPVWEACIDAKEAHKKEPEHIVAKQPGFVSFSEIALKQTGRHVLGGNTSPIRSNPNTVSLAIHQKTKELMFRIVIGASVCARERFILGDIVDPQVDLNKGELLIIRSPVGRYSLCLPTRLDRERYAKDPNYKASLIITGKIFEGFPYHQFRDSMRATILEHRHEEQGLVLKLVRHPNAQSNESGW